MALLHYSATGFSLWPPSGKQWDLKQTECFAHNHILTQISNLDGVQSKQEILLWEQKALLSGYTFLLLLYSFFCCTIETV